jgi:hypothetical protein
MNERFLELIQLLGDSGYQVKAITQKKTMLDKNDMPYWGGKPIGDIVLRISPTRKLESEVTQ